MGKADADDPGLPDLPPEWGQVVVPDDAAALAKEAEQVRRELRRRTAGQSRRQRPLTFPAVVLLITVIAMVAVLSAVTWSRAGRDTPVPAVASPDPALAQLTGRALPALDLVDAGQSPVPLRGLLPAVVLLVDGCACPHRVTEAAAATPTGVNVVTVGAQSPQTAPAATGVHALGDPAGALRAFLHLPARSGAVTALLADRTGRITLVVAEVDSVADYQAELVALAD